MSGTPALAVAGVCRSFGGLRAVDQVDLTLGQGERRGIIGPNGAGKTTLFNLIAGEVAPTAGGIALFGRDVTRLPPQRRAALGLARTFQVNTLFPNLTVTENLLLAVQGTMPTKLRIHRPLSSYRELHEQARSLLGSLGLEGAGETMARALSHGEQRQLEVALALASHPRVLLLDEPTAGLSLAESQRLTSLLKRLDRSMSLLVIEHDMDVVFDLAERITVLHEGKVIAEGDRSEVRANALVKDIYLGTG
ncbi:MAG TPA: ABC transporter ATP-binding protein [Myxococcales bacterium]|nr:ABC transporter ATP-binding protein [Myxococcales bacterium]